MKKWLLILLGVLLGVGAYLYQDPHWRKQIKQEARQLQPGPSHTTVYKWQDSKGHWQLTSEPPPAGTRYEAQTYRADTNVIPADKLTGEEAD